MQTRTSEHIAWILKSNLYSCYNTDFSFVHTWDAKRERKLQSRQDFFSAHVQDVHICFATVTAAFTKSTYCEDICLRGGTRQHAPFQAVGSFIDPLIIKISDCVYLCPRWFLMNKWNSFHLFKLFFSEDAQWAAEEADAPEATVMKLTGFAKARSLTRQRFAVAPSASTQLLGNLHPNLALLEWVFVEAASFIVQQWVIFHCFN